MGENGSEPEEPKTLVDRASAWIAKHPVYALLAPVIPLLLIGQGMSGKDMPAVSLILVVVCWAFVLSAIWKQPLDGSLVEIRTKRGLGGVATTLLAGFLFWFWWPEKADVAPITAQDTKEIKEGLRDIKASVSDIPHHRSMDGGQEATFLGILKQAPPGMVVVYCNDASQEACDFANQLEDSLKALGWSTQGVNRGGGSSNPEAPITITFNPANGPAAARAERLGSAFTALGLEYKNLPGLGGPDDGFLGLRVEINRSHPAIQERIHIWKVDALPYLPDKSATVRVHYKTTSGSRISEADYTLSLVTKKPESDWDNERIPAENEIWQDYERTRVANSKKASQMFDGGAGTLDMVGLVLTSRDISNLRHGMAYLYFMAYIKHEGRQVRLCGFIQQEEGPMFWCDTHNGVVTP